MPFDKFIDIETILEQRSKAIAKSLRTLSLEELKKLGDQIFDSRIIRDGKSSFN